MSFRYEKKTNYTQEDLDKILGNHSTYSKKGLFTLEEKNAAIKDATDKAVNDYKETSEYKKPLEKLKELSKAEFSRTVQDDEDIKKLLEKIPEKQRAREIKALNLESGDLKQVKTQLGEIITEFYPNTPPAIKDAESDFVITDKGNEHDMEH